MKSHNDPAPEAEVRGHAAKLQNSRDWHRSFAGILTATKLIPASISCCWKTAGIVYRAECSRLPGGMSNHSCIDIRVAETLTKLFEHLLSAPSLHIQP